MPQPRLDPHLVGGAVEDPIDGHPIVGQVEQQLQEDVSARAGAHDLRPGGHERAGQPLGEEVLVRR